jgi:hypothetical protein
METEKDKRKQDRWKLCEGGGIVWDINQGVKPHEDHLEMSGEYVSQHVRYGADEQGKVQVEQTLVWPWLRMIPNDTHGSMKSVQQGAQVNPVIYADGQEISFAGKQIRFDGILSIYEEAGNGLEMFRSYYPSMEHKGAFCKIKLVNESPNSLICSVYFEKKMETKRGGEGIYIYESNSSMEGAFVLEPGASEDVYTVFTANFLYDQKVLEGNVGSGEEEKRRDFLKQTENMLELETEDVLLNQAFAFAKIRSTESIFRTKGGLMHSPGGLHYYGGIWTNDQAEYTNPFFAFTGMEKPVESAMNCYRLFRSFMGPGMECIPSSIVAEGLAIWEGKGDRGDAAMYAYGLSRFLLTLGDREVAEAYFDSLVWSLEYCEKKKTKDGVIQSDSDELEGRFPSGKTNLATACLTYEALRAAAILAQELYKEELSDTFETRRKSLGEAIEIFFGRNLAGFETYRYCEVDDHLRAWICIPLTMGIMKRKKGTVEALISKHLWRSDGLLTMEGDATFWDRATLYALRGMFAAGESDVAIQYLKEYSRRRLLGEHVPYPVEAYPEGDGRHLSAESALYARILVEGLFGIVPMGLKVFQCCPSLPQDWKKVTLKKIQYGGNIIDLTIYQVERQYKICVSINGKNEVYHCKRGEGVRIALSKERK